LSNPVVEQGTHVVVDDQLALLATLGVLILPDGVRGTLTTTYAWQLRLTQALVSGRSTEGTLQRLVAMAQISRAAALARVTRPDPTLLDVIDPRPLVWEVAALRVEHRANQLAAETVAAARHLGAVIRVSEGNSHGHVHDQAAAAGIDFGVWRLGDTPNGLTPIS
jgi:nucleotide-binding universal stress UspA family protein